jgi:hypothetical protein
MAKAAITLDERGLIVSRNRFLQATLAAGASLVCVGIVAMATSQRVWALAAEAMTSDDAKTWNALLTDKDHEAILKLQTESVESAMKSSGTFLRGYRNVQRAGFIIASLGNMAAAKGQGEEAKKGAALREAGAALAAAAKKKSYAEAKKAVDTIAAYPKSIAASGESKALKFTDVIPIEQLMKEVNMIDTATRKSGKAADADFARQAKELGLRSRLMSCLAVIARDYKEEKDWKGWCDEMREGSVELAKQYEKKDQKAAKEAYNKLQKSCTDCHDVYRMEE